MVYTGSLKLYVSVIYLWCAGLLLVSLVVVCTPIVYTVIGLTLVFRSSDMCNRHLLVSIDGDWRDTQVRLLAWRVLGSGCDMVGHCFYFL